MLQKAIVCCHALRKTTNIDGPLVVLFLPTIIVSASENVRWCTPLYQQICLDEIVFDI